MGLYDEYVRLANESELKSNKNLTATQGIEQWTKEHDADARFLHLRNVISAHVKNPAELYQKILKEAPQEVVVAVKGGLVHELNNFILNRIKIDNPLRKKIEKVDSFSKDNAKLDEYIGALNEVAESLSPEDKKAYDSINFLDGLAQGRVRVNVEYFAKLFDDALTEDDKKEIDAEMERFVDFSKASGDDYTEPFNAKLLENLKAQAKTDEERNALDYIESNIRVANESYDKYLHDRGKAYDDQLLKHDKEVLDEYYESHPEYKDLYAKTGPGPGYRLIDEDRRDVFDKLNNESEYQLTAETREALATALRKLDDLDIVDGENVVMAEEATKCYGMLAVHRAMINLNTAMKEGRVSDLPKLTREYRIARKKTDDLVDFCGKHFGQDPLLYGQNVDVSRNPWLPVEYRLKNREAAQISSLLNCLKICKVENVSIDEFVKAPNRYISQAREKLFDRYNIDKRSEGRSLGDKLYMMDYVPDSSDSKMDLGLALLCSRADEGFRCFEPDHEMSLHNTNLAVFNITVKHDSANLEVMSAPLVNDREKTIHNLILFDENTPVHELIAAKGDKYDRKTHVVCKNLDVDAKLKEKQPDYTAYTEKIKNIVSDYRKNCMLSGRLGNEETYDAIKSFPDMILEHRPEDKDLPEFKSMQAYVESIDEKLHIKEVFDVTDNPNEPISDKTKYLALNAYDAVTTRYADMPLSSRIWSYVPFVRNDAYYLRKEIKEGERLMKSRGITKDEIDATYEGTLPNEVTDEHYPLDVNTLKISEIDCRKDYEKTYEKNFNEQVKSESMEYSLGDEFEVGSPEDEFKKEFKKQLLADGPELD